MKIYLKRIHDLIRLPITIQTIAIQIQWDASTFSSWIKPFVVARMRSIDAHVSAWCTKNILTTSRSRCWERIRIVIHCYIFHKFIKDKNEIRIHFFNMLLTNQTAYQKADYLRDYQKYHQYWELSTTQVFDYCALHLLALCLSACPLCHDSSHGYASLNFRTDAEIRRSNNKLVFEPG
jgi:hypothetical protein